MVHLWTFFNLKTLLHFFIFKAKCPELAHQVKVNHVLTVNVPLLCQSWTLRTLVESWTINEGETQRQYDEHSM